ncbi:MAG: ABC transporter ATP-binding protein [Gaiellales bacterium]
MSDEPLIRADNLVKRYEGGRISALAGMSLTVAPGEFVGIVGPSGCGKSTLLHLLAALERPDAGTLVVAGHDLTSHRALNHYRARHVGIVFQLHNLLPNLTAAENVQIPMFETGLPAGRRQARAIELLGMVGLADRLDNKPTELSGGERQRVAIARALANEPPLVLADEPTGSLDSKAGSQVLDLLERVRAEQGVTLVLVTHDTRIAARAERLVEMLDGHAVAPVAAR